jgi:prepilin-type N-terminal cleavage/methylation domain-containing protein
VRRVGKGPHGFTLLELVAVLAIVGILAGATVTVALRIEGVRAAAAVDALVAHIRYLQSVALAKNLRTWVVFDTAANEYRGYEEDPANPGRAGRQLAVDPLTRKNMTIDLDEGFMHGVRLATAAINGGTELSFDSYGAPYDQAGTALATQATIGFADGSNVTISPETGYCGIGS